MHLTVFCCGFGVSAWLVTTSSPAEPAANQPYVRIGWYNSSTLGLPRGLLLLVPSRYFLT